MEPKAVTLLRCGRLIDGVDDVPRENVTVVIVGDKIEQVYGGFDTKLHPEDATVIDLREYTLLPGLIDCHCHPLISPDDYQIAHLKHSSAYKALRGAAVCRRMLQCGWTTIRIAGDADVHYAHIDLKRAIEEGIADGPRITAAGHYLSITGGGGDINFLAPEAAGCVHPDGRIVNGASEMRRTVREEIKYGSDWIKLLVTGAFMTEGDNPMSVHFTDKEIRTAVEEATRLGKHVMAHAHSAEGIKAAARAGVRSIEHGSFIDAEGIAMLKEKGIFLVPTTFIDVFYAEHGNAPGKMAQLLPTRADSIACIRRAFEAGVKICAGTDFVGWEPLEMNARELECLHRDVGMPQMEVIKAATSRASELLGFQNRLGSVEVGKLADLIAVRGNPCEDITELQRVRFVMLGGKVKRPLE
eukprot:TRINITY_DN11345_c0_g1_i1.p1 TRINITY_DN11345_c0_g1~~TRINITY_DN11345_c0_g1_i1.p1  ORF type:complete len:413 (+),score=129.77 TRINITY_DN11345_c0_g1_i1:107-1345(+)